VLSTFFQWVHVVSSVMAVGGYAFLLIALLPSLRILDLERRELLLRAVFERFRWVIWAVILALLASGLYNTRLAWEAPWGTYWKLLTIKIVLSFIFFAISLCLTLPLAICKRLRFRRETGIAIALVLSSVILLISTYLRRS
jgi:uncharacterized membrane protein